MGGPAAGPDRWENGGGALASGQTERTIAGQISQAAEEKGTGTTEDD